MPLRTGSPLIRRRGSEPPTAGSWTRRLNCRRRPVCHHSVAVSGAGEPDEINFLGRGSVCARCVRVFLTTDCKMGYTCVFSSPLGWEEVKGHFEAYL